MALFKWMIEQHYRFPTIGEVVRELFNAAGILPQKNDDTRVVGGDKHKKAIQKSLARLAEEHSKISSQLDDLMDLFGEIIYELLEDERVTLVIMASIKDALEQYKDLVRQDGTYLLFSDSIKWLIDNRLIDRLLISLFKNSLAYDLKSLGLTLPDDRDWWLPQSDGNDSPFQFPIKKVWQWIYVSQGLSQSRFHNPAQAVYVYHADKTLIEKYKQYERNLDNAQRWTSGHQLPSAHALIRNLNESLDALMVCCSDKSDKREVSTEQLKSYRVMLFLSRIATYAFKSVQKAYGDEYLKQVVTDFKKQHRRYVAETASHRHFVEQTVGRLNVPSLQKDEFWHEAVMDLWWFRADKLMRSAQKVQHYLSLQGERMSQRSQIRLLINNLGAANAYGLLKQCKYTSSALVPDQFPELLMAGLTLKRQKSSLDDIREYEAKVYQAELMDLLCWLIEWIKAAYYYRCEDDEKAFPHFKQAFELARYSVGKEQYLLVNQYIESCAKTENYREFKKAVSWANYLGIDVRWLRGLKDPESEQSMRTVYAFMKNARYWQL